MNKYKIFIDPVKEEEWINNIQQKGYRLTNISVDFIYKFIKTDKEYITRIDYQDYMNKERYEEYVSIHEEFGWEHIRGGRSGMMTQVWSKIPDGNDELFSDRESKINFYKRYGNMAATFAVLCLVYMILLMPENQDLFLTPGLSDMEGMEFYRAFLFELPFAFLRLLPAILFPFLTVILIIAYYRMDKAKKELEKEY